MSSVTKTALQRDVFEQHDERIQGFICVTGITRKKKHSVLCLTISYLHPVTVRLHELRRSDKASQWEKKNTWLLNELKVVDGINPRKQSPEFHFTVDKLYRWLADSANLKDPFIRQMWKLSHRYLSGNKPEFVNISIPVEELEVANGNTSLSYGETSSQPEAADEYQPISDKEEADFRLLISKFNLKITDAEKFTELLTRELQLLDGANIQAIVGSEEQIAELLNVVDEALNEASRLEQVLVGYDDLLAQVKDGIEMMEEKDLLINTYFTNRQRLMNDLEAFIEMLNLTADDQNILNECDLSTTSKILQCTEAAKKLKTCLKSTVPFGMERMTAYLEQMSLLESITNQFANRLVAHLTALFNTLVQETIPVVDWSLPKHDLIFTALKPFRDLISWLKAVLPQGYQVVMDRYASCANEIYHYEVVTFFDHAKLRIRPAFPERRATLRPPQSSDMTRIIRSSSATSLAKRDDVEEALPLDTEQFRSIVETVVNAFESIVQSEKKFCICFFSLDASNVSPEDNQSMGEEMDRKMERQLNDQIRTLLSSIFQCADEALNEYLDYCKKVNPFYIVYLLAFLTERVMINDSAEHSSIILGKFVVLVKRRFDTFMEGTLQNMSYSKSVKRAKLGILPALRQFQFFATEVEEKYEGFQRRGDLDRWYPKFVDAICEAIEKAAEDPYSKSPPAVVQMENYHNLHCVLSHLKISCLNAARKQIKVKYQRALDSYVKECLGKPLEKLQIFLEQVEELLDQGMKPEDISFQQAFNKQEIRRLLNLYSGKEVQKGLKALYNTIEQHLSTETNLLQVVWHNMQEEFIHQYEHNEQLIATCYANSDLQLEFSVDDLLRYFSEIALQH